MRQRRMLGPPIPIWRQATVAGLGGANNQFGVGAGDVFASTAVIPGGTELAGELGDNGGPTQTIALSAGSVAIDAGDNALAVDADGNALTTDQRGSGYARINDGDGDGTDTVDAGAFEAVEVVLEDSDGDGIPDISDNATFVFNPDQRDTDSDNYGNVVDPDLDNDGFVGPLDAVLFGDAFGTESPVDPSDPNTGSDADFDGDGVVGPLDAVIFQSFFGDPPGSSFIDFT